MGVSVPNDRNDNPSTIEAKGFVEDDLPKECLTKEGLTLAYKNILLPDTYAQEEVKQRGSILQKLLQRSDCVQLI